VAVSVRAVPLVIRKAHGVGAAQFIASAESIAVPEPLPPKATVRTGEPAPPLPLLVKQTTFAVINPVTTAPDDDIPPALLPVLTVAEINVPPQDSPVAVSKPVAASTVNIWGVFDDQVAWFVMSFVTGGWIYVPSARN
jgi:hypothetical protein